MERYLDLGTILKPTQKDGTIRWKSIQHVMASLKLIDHYIRISHFCMLKVPRYPVITNTPMTNIDMASVIYIAWDEQEYSVFLRCSFADTQSYPLSKLHKLKNGDLTMKNMIYLFKAHAPKSFIFFDDIIRAIIMYRRDQMFAMLLAIKSKQDNALNRAARHPLWESQLLRLIGQII